MRIILKISGEALKGDYNISEENLEKIYKDIIDIKQNNELIIVVGGGNFWRGRNKLDINNVISDQIGMLGTVMNALAITSYLNQKGIISSCYSAFEVLGIIKKSNMDDVNKDLKDGKVIVLGGGLGVPNLSTDMTTVSKGIEYGVDLILMSKNIDAIYDKDPREEDAKKIDEISHEELLKMSLNQGVSSLTVLDLEALVELAKHKIPLYVYNSGSITNIKEVLEGKSGTRVITKN